VPQPAHTNLPRRFSLFSGLRCKNNRTEWQQDIDRWRVMLRKLGDDRAGAAGLLWCGRCRTCIQACWIAQDPAGAQSQTQTNKHPAQPLQPSQDSCQPTHYTTDAAGSPLVSSVSTAGNTSGHRCILKIFAGYILHPCSP
jgi:hypothetical protein